MAARKKKSSRKKPVAGSGRGRTTRTKRQKRLAAAAIESSSSAREGIKPKAAQQSGVRLNKWLAEQGVDSRRKCDEKIFGGEVSVNGSVVTEPGYRVEDGDDVRVDGVKISVERRLYYLFYKPKGVLCTNDPRESAVRVCDLVDPLVPSRVHSVGRLDKESEGLLLLTNDGDFSQVITHPSYGIRKTYICYINHSVAHADIEKARDGAYIDGVKVIPESLRLVNSTKKGATVEVTISEGRNREVRRVLARFDMRVKRLKRVRIGNLSVAKLKRGAIRPLTKKERDDLV
ncbi:MAG: pseudouridine synthase, partial [Planctomycetota bacterium]|nr:pseudouridine synthase [Planctomycetota bacterium]